MTHIKYNGIMNNNRPQFKKKGGNPDSFLYTLIFMLAGLLRKGCQSLHIDNEKIKGLKAPFIVLCNHVSFYDFYYVSELLSDYRPAYVINRLYTRRLILKFISNRIGMIPKKLFAPDMAALSIARMIKAGYPVVIFPEGRLSVDGKNSPIFEDASLLYKRLGVDIVIVQLRGAYFSKPRWRSKFFRSDIYASVREHISKEEIAKISVDEIRERIVQGISHADSENPINTYHQKNRAKGLENILYRCADCGKLYTTRSRGADICCISCGSIHHLNENYLFDDEIKSIPVYYNRIKEMEKRELKNTLLSAQVKVKITSDTKPYVKKERGICTLSKDVFTYRSKSGGFTKKSEEIMALSFYTEKSFKLYHKQCEYAFFPEQNKQQIVRWAVIVDIINENAKIKENM